MDKWKKQDINNLEFEGLCENFYYYKRKMGYGPAAIKEYDANGSIMRLTITMY